MPETRLTTIYNGVDAQRFLPGGERHATLPLDFAAGDSIVIGTIGRLDPLKNQTTLVDAFLRSIATRPALRARLRRAVIGDGLGRAQIEAMLAAAQARDLA